MDYDENDFQSQNFQLAREDKFPSSLQSFSLPKIDLDEHLRFENLVEAEHLLGIQSQGNNWIDFSPVSSAIEFSSSAAESRSISRHNNVWSEATSSESVEMLLKSVGEDEMINNNAVVMEVSANDVSHGMDNQVNLYVKKDDTDYSTVVETLPRHQELVQGKCYEKVLGVSEDSRNLVAHLQGSSQAACRSPSNGKFSSANITGDQSMEDKKVTSLYGTTEKSSAADKVLHEPDSSEIQLCDVLMRKNVLNTTDSSVMVSLSSESLISRSSQVAESVMVSHNSETRLCSDGRHEGVVDGRSGFITYDSQSEKSLLMPRDNKTFNQFLHKSDALVALNNKSCYPVSSDGLLLASSHQAKSLKDANMQDYEISVKEEDKSRLEKKQDADFDSSTSDISSKASVEMPNSTVGCKSFSYIQPENSEEDGLHDGRNQAFKSSICDNPRGNPDSSMNSIDRNLQPDAEFVTISNSDVENATRVLNESHALIHVAENQATELKDSDGLIIKPHEYSVACTVTGKINVDRSDVILDAANDIAPDESSLHFSKSDVKAKTSDSISFKPHMYGTGKSVADSSEVHIPQHDSLENKYSSMPCINKDSFDVHKASNVMDNVHDLIPTNFQVAEGLSLDCLSAKKVVQEELDSDPVFLGLEKSAYVHWTPLEDTTNGDEFEKQREPIGQSVSASDTNYSDGKDFLFSRDPTSSLPTTFFVSEKASEMASVSYAFDMKDTSSEKLLQDDLGLKLASPDETMNSWHPKETVGLDLAIEQKKQSCSAAPTCFISEENKIQLSGNLRLSNSSKSLDMDKVKGRDASSHYVEESLMNNRTEYHQHTVLQPSSSVQRIDPSPCCNESASSLGSMVGNGSSFMIDGNDISHGSSIDGKDVTINSLEAFSHMRTDSSIDFDNVAKEYGNDSSKECNWIVGGSNLKAKSGNSSSSAHDFGSQTDISCSECLRGDPKNQEPNKSPLNFDGAAGNKALVSSAKDGFSHNVESSNHDLKHMAASSEARSFTFEVSTSGDLLEKVTNNEWKSFPSLQPIDISQMPKGDIQVCLEERKEIDIPSKTSIGGKSKNVLKIFNEKKIGWRAKCKKEVSAPNKFSGMEVKCSGATPESSGTLSKDMQLVEMPECSFVECSTMNKPSSLSVQTSGIPDLNSSSSLTYFHQPFTDVQQVQLRAQIFVYGTLISGTPPDEACMTSVFGETEGGRTLWESLWRASVTRFQNQNSPIGGIQTHFQPAPSANDVQSKERNTNAAKSTSFVASSDVLSSTVSLPSPLWNMSSDGLHADISRGKLLDFCQIPSPLHPYQLSQSRQYIGVNSPSLSQSPHPRPWFISSRSSVLAETLHVTPLRDSSGSWAPTMQVVPPSVLMATPGPTATTVIPSFKTEMKKSTLASWSNKSTTNTHKARKMIKDLTPEEPSLPLSQNTAEYVSASSVVKSLQLPVSNKPLPSKPPVKVLSDSPVSIGSPHIISPAHYQIIGGNNNNQQKAIFSEETCNKIKQARLQAEDAAALAASTVKHSQAIWSQLAVQKSSGLVSESDKLAYAAVAAALAASVAKAAAAAAKVASDAALQAKIMADESLSSEKSGNSVKSPEAGMLDVGKKLGGLTPISILKGKDEIVESGSVVSAAREFARRPVESASATTQRAENLDALLKAAELAAEAVAQSGTILAMGDPLPFTLGELEDTGPEGIWKTHQPASAQLLQPCSQHGEENAGLSNAKEHVRLANKSDLQFPSNIEMKKAAGEGKLSSINEIHQQFEGKIEGNLTNTEPEGDHSASYTSIKRGSIVEVMSDEDGLRGAWCSARVLDIKDNKAYVCFNDAFSEGELKEWILLVSEGGKAPRIRTAHSATSLKYEGTRKRRREHIGSYIWAVGDHVDAWIHDRWWEGTVAETIPGDETKLTLHFPARGDKQVVHVWNLRPSLIWKNGQWIEWCHLRENSLKSHEGDTQEKRQRICEIEITTSLEVDRGVIDKLSRNVPIEESKNPKHGSLVLSAKDRTFSIGKNSVGQITSDALKTKRSGLQKEGSRVAIGDPKPGKRRKFMEVSKHFVAESQKINEGNDSIKFAKYLMPQTSRQLRSTSNVDIKGTKNGESKSNGGIKVNSSKGFQTASQGVKDNVLFTTKEGIIHETHANGHFSNNAEPTDVPVADSESSVQPAPIVPLSKKTNVPRSEALKGKSTLDWTIRSERKVPENPGKAIPEATEPRRSNRAIQPTSRLLEGLQSSLIISKFPNIVQERNQHRGGSSSRGNTHG